MSPDEYYELQNGFDGVDCDNGFDEERMGYDDYDPPMGCLGDEDIYHDGIHGED